MAVALASVLALAACGADSSALTSVSAGEQHTCGVKTNGSVVCWGDDEYGQSTPPSGKFASVSAGDRHTCGVKTNGSVACWGDDEHGKSTPPSGKFTYVGAGLHYTCGLTTNGSTVCWGGYDEESIWQMPGEFTSISVSLLETCGVKTDGSIACSGDDQSERTSAYIPRPTGKFASVSVGHSHACGVKTNGSVECWGREHEGEATPPYGKFAMIDAGFMHTCGVRNNGSVDCWGSNWRGQSTPPWEKFDAESCDSKIAQTRERTSPPWPPPDAQWPPGRDLSGIEFGFEVTSGETVQMRLTQRNITDQTVRFQIGDGDPNFLAVRVENCATVWIWKPIILLPIFYRELMPHEERVWLPEWERTTTEGKPVEPGEYLVYAIYGFIVDDWPDGQGPHYLSLPHKVNVGSHAD